MKLGGPKSEESVFNVRRADSITYDLKIGRECLVGEDSELSEEEARRLGVRVYEASRLAP